MLYGIHTGDGEIVAVALSQVGNVGGEPYWSWYGFDSRVEWCACFVSWAAEQCGYIEAGVIPKFAACASQGVPWFQERGQWQDNSYEPNSGDIIFFDWNQDGGQGGKSDHVGIVEKVENGRVYTIKGSSGDSCRQNSYPIGYYEIYGYGTQPTNRKPVAFKSDWYINVLWFSWVLKIAATAVSIFLPLWKIPDTFSRQYAIRLPRLA